ncbi:MAG: hypothetical protein N3B01_10655, partial [Verrucomicrobiae bacterium]|nr:hypothetical protein [Verrucomicrobiae bacterium]
MQVRCKISIGSGRGLGALVLTALLFAGAAAWGQEAATGGGAAPKQVEATYWDMIKHGGPTLVILFLCSIFTTTLIIERFMYYRKAQGNTAAMLEKIKQAGTLSEALAAIESEPGVAGGG